jgi:[NiFe] hydrogenase diaphorase moiety large subunit
VSLCSGVSETPSMAMLSEDEREVRRIERYQQKLSALLAARSQKAASKAGSEPPATDTSSVGEGPAIDTRGWQQACATHLSNLGYDDVLLEESLRPGEAIRAALERGATAGSGRQATLDEIKNARLLGRGGAGFTTGVKWESCSRQPVTPRVVVCNADEGEPGTFKDRLLLGRRADMIFEGMTVAAWGIGASQGFVYLRGEYRYLLEQLEAVLERRREANLLGAGICSQPGFDFDIRIHVGAGSYV